MSNFACGQMENRVEVANYGEFYGMKLGMSTRCFSSHAQISGVLGNDRFMEGIPLPSPSIDTFPAANYFENQGKLTTSGTLARPFENTKTGVANTSVGVSASFETMLRDYEGLQFDTSSKWDFSKFTTPPELLGRVVGRNGVLPVQPTGSCLPNEWTMIEHAGLNSNSTGSSRFSNELSLSLATSQPSALPEHCSELSSSGVTIYSLNDRRLVSERTSCSSRDISLSFNACKPLQLPPLLSGSSFIQTMQGILAEIACFALESIKDGLNVSFSSGCIAGRGNMSTDFPDGFNRGHAFMFPNKRNIEAKKKHLLALLQLVDEQYNQCLDEVHTVTSAFYAVSELDPNLHTRFALLTISSMYKNLRERISSHFLAIGAHLNEEETREDESSEMCFIQKQWALQQLNQREHQLWRPQRGLSKKSVSVLKAWMFQNFLHPYPKDAEKHALALRSGLTRNQVSNWFINARVRLWKPMIQEMCAEMNRRKVRCSNEEMEKNRRNHVRFEARRFTMD